MGRKLTLLVKKYKFATYNEKIILVLDNKANILYNTKCRRYGEVAQLARASGSYPAGQEFESPLRHHNLKNTKK